MVIHACGRVGHGLPLGATDCEPRSSERRILGPARGSPGGRWIVASPPHGGPRRYPRKVTHQAGVGQQGYSPCSRVGHGLPLGATDCEPGSSDRCGTSERDSAWLSCCFPGADPGKATALASISSSSSGSMGRGSAWRRPYRKGNAVFLPHRDRARAQARAFGVGRIPPPKIKARACARALCPPPPAHSESRAVEIRARGRPARGRDQTYSRHDESTPGRSASHDAPLPRTVPARLRRADPYPYFHFHCILILIPISSSLF